MRESLEQRITDLGDRQLKDMEESAVKAAEESDAWQKRIKSTEDQVRVLAQMLQNLPQVKEIDINLRVNGIADLQNITAVMAGTQNTAAARQYDGYYTMGGNTYWNDGTLADNGTSYVEARANGGPVKPYATYRVNENGTEFLTMGSQGGFITPAGQAGGQGGLSIEGPVQVILPNVTNQSTADDMVRQMIPALKKYMGRSL
jgi:hypothetical protein